jgi:hypothetical protein
LLFWNNAPASLTNGKIADGVVGPSNFNAELSPSLGEIQADGQGWLWALRMDTISVYNLPLTTSAAPFYTLQPPVPVAGGGSIGWTDALDIAGIAVTSDSSYLWLADPNNNRVIRIRDPLSDPVVDVVLGQANATGDQCNRGAAQPARDSLCNPGNVAFDRNGNVYVSDHALEARGNHRLLEYDASLFPASPATALFAVQASRVYGTNGSFTASSCQDLMCGPWDPAFDPLGQMVVGMNAYIGSRFPVFYQDPLNNTSPPGTLNDYYSMAYATHYDSSGNLYITDRNRGRVLIYLSPTLAPDTPAPTASPTASATRTATRTPTVTRTATPTDTATLTETPTRTRTPTETATATFTPTGTSTLTPAPTSTASRTPTLTAPAPVTATPSVADHRLYLPLIRK